MRLIHWPEKTDWKLKKARKYLGCASVSANEWRFEAPLLTSDLSQSLGSAEVGHRAAYLCVGSPRALLLSQLVGSCPHASPLVAPKHLTSFWFLGG